MAFFRALDSLHAALLPPCCLPCLHHTSHTQCKFERPQLTGSGIQRLPRPTPCPHGWRLSTAATKHAAWTCSLPPSPSEHRSLFVAQQLACSLRPACMACRRGHTHRHHRRAMQSASRNVTAYLSACLPWPILPSPTKCTNPSAQHMHIHIIHIHTHVLTHQVQGSGR